MNDYGLVGTTGGDGLIRDMARIERPQIRLEKLGVEAMRDAELLALTLNLKSIYIAENLLKAHTLTDLVMMPLGRLARLKGVGKAKASAFVTSRELMRRADGNRVNDQPAIHSVNDIVGQTVELRDKKKEHLMAFFLNARHQLIAKEIISIGTLTASLAHPREIFSPAIGKAAAGVIIVHNHPSGDPTPSEEDIRLTRRISQAGLILGIDLLDHLIVAENGCYSFKSAGAL